MTDNASKQNLLFSVVIPVYQVEVLLPRCIDSIVGQNISDYEIILVDDGSKDNSGKVCDQYAEKYPQIKVIHQTNKGLSGARNSGMRVAHGEYVIFVDSDDSVKAGAFESLTETIAKNEKYPDMIALGFSRIEENQSIDFFYPLLKKNEVYSCDEFLLCSMGVKEYRCEAWSYAYKRSFLQMNNLFFKEGIFHEDLEWNIRLLNRKPTFEVAKKPFYNYIIREGSITTGANRLSKINDLCDIYKAWYKFSGTINNEKLKKTFSAFFVKNYIYSFATYAVQDSECNWHLNKKFILSNYSDFKEFIRNAVFVFFRSSYYKMFKHHGH